MRFLFFLMLITLFSTNKIDAENHQLGIIKSDPIGNTKHDDCELGEKRALTDINNKVYILQSLGHMVDKEFDPFLIQFAKEKYNIKITSAPCVIFMEPKCYTETMRAFVLNKYGKDIEFRMKDEAIAAFKKTDYYVKNIKSKIDADSIFTNNHTYAEFSKNYNSPNNRNSILKTSTILILEKD